MCQYKIFLSATDKEIADKSKMRVDLFGDMKIKDIAEMLGFSDQYYFSKVFKQQYGVSPQTYRSQICGTDR